MAGRYDSLRASLAGAIGKKLGSIAAAGARGTIAAEHALGTIAAERALGTIAAERALEASGTASTAQEVVDLHGGVQGVQDELKDLGFYKGRQDGAYGEQTIAAMKAFQSAVGRPPTGTADRDTLSVLGVLDVAALCSKELNEIQKQAEEYLGHKIDVSKIPALSTKQNMVFATLGDIMNSDKSEIIQGGLTNLGLYRGKRDDIYGDQTAAAVKAFQSAVGLPPTGSADRKTLVALVIIDDVNLAVNPTAEGLKTAEARLGRQIDVSKLPALHGLDKGQSRLQKKQPTP